MDSNNRNDKIILHKDDLPISIELIGNDGERISYRLLPAGRKFGAFMTKPEKAI